MPFQELTIVPGVNTEKTKSDNVASISYSNYIRWREDLPEKRGGCTLYFNARLFGVTNMLHAFVDVNDQSYLAIGTTTNVYLYNSTTLRLSDISPSSTTTNITPSFSTTSGSSFVTVTDTSFPDVTIYDSIVLETPISVGGLVLSGYYKVELSQGTNAYQIQAMANGAPQNATSTVTNGGVTPEFTTTSGESTVVVAIPNHPYQNNQLVSFSIPTTVGGVTIFGEYLIGGVIAGVSFTINASTQASASASAFMNGGLANIVYWVTNGPSIVGSGYGINGYGLGGYGTGLSTAPAVTGTYTAPDWYFDNWNQTLIMSAEGGPIFSWGSETGYTNAQIIENAPIVNNGAFVAMPQQQIMAWGSTYTSVSDPLQIRWSDISDFNVWYPTVTNQAGGYRIPTGSKIQRGIQGSAQAYWWTDIDLYVSQYVGPPFVYNFNKVSSNCGLVASKAVTNMSGNLYWMSQKQFFMMSQGAMPEPIPCPVWDVIFQNLNYNYIDNIKCGSNSQFNEVTWFYPSANSLDGTNDSYVCYNTIYHEWDFGLINRNYWINQSILGGPIAADSNGYIYQHETSNDNAGIPINAYFQTGYFSLASGNDLVFVDWLLPDFKFGQWSQASNATMQISFNVEDYPDNQATTFGPYTVTQGTSYIEPRFRGRYMQFTVGSSDLGSFWRLGSLRYRVAASGRR